MATVQSTSGPVITPVSSSAPSGPNPPKGGCCNCVVEHLGLTKRILCDDTSSGGKVAKLAAKIIQFVEYMKNQPLSRGWVALRISGLGFSELAEVFDAVKRLYKLVEGKVMRTNEKISSIFFAIYRTLGAFKFLDKAGLTNFGEVATKLGKLPVLGLIFWVPVTIFGSISCTFNILYHKEKLGEYNSDTKVNKAMAEIWSTRAELYLKIDSNNVLSEDEVKAYRTRFTNAIAEIRLYKGTMSADNEAKKVLSGKDYGYVDDQKETDNQFDKFLGSVKSLHPEQARNINIISAVQANIGFHSGTSSAQDKQYLKERLTYETARWTKLSDNMKYHTRHAWMTIASDSSKIAINTLAFIFAATSGVIVIAGLVVAVLSLLSAAYIKKYDIKENKTMHVPKEPEIVAGYRALAHNKGLVAAV